MKVLIVANGDTPSQRLLFALEQKTELTCVTDGAVNSLPSGIRVDKICGDFDSIDKPGAALKFPRAEFIELADQSATDLEKTISFVLEKGASELHVAGGLGKRIDHQLATLSLLQKFHTEVLVSLYTEHEQMTVLSPHCVRKGILKQDFTAHQTISMIALSPEATVSLTGVTWPLREATLTLGSKGVSNCTKEGGVELTVHGGVIAWVSPF